MNAVEEALRTAERTGEFSLLDGGIDQLPRELLSIPNLRSVRLHQCPITELPNWYSRLDIELLNISFARFEYFPKEIYNQTGLRHLGLAGNAFKAIPGGIHKLQNLESICLSSCGLTSTPIGVNLLKSLTSLDLSFNEIRDPNSILLPPHLEHLTLTGNPLNAVPLGIRDLRFLRNLEFSSAGTYSSGYDAKINPLRPSFPGSLTRVTGVAPESRLGLVVALPTWLFDIRGLEWLDFTGQLISEIPETVGNLGDLRGLLFSANLLTRLPDSVVQLTSLEALSATGNRLATLPEGITVLRGLRHLGLNDNDLPIPPEVLSRPDAPDEIWAYLDSIRDNRRALNEAKLLVVGEGSVGKSSIIRRLTRGDFAPDERKTEGIDVTRWSVPANGADVTVNLWDFGGQEIMHATHQFFLTRRSVYLLVVDARQSEEQNRIEYWLKLIQGFSGGSPVILVGNKCENFDLDIDQTGLRAKYPDIVAIIQTSCADNVGFQEVREVLQDTLGRMTHVRDLLPESFFMVKEHLEQLDADYLPFATYEALCRERGVTTPAAQERLVEFLHDLGTVLCFRRDPRLRDTNILNPSWVTGGVYRLLNSLVAAQAKGLLTWHEIDTILDEERYVPEKRQYIVDMMKKFELCFESDDVFLIPDLLTKEEPFTGRWDDTLDFTIQYGVLPSSIIGRLIVRLHHLISQGTVWRTGVVFVMDGNNRALVKADREEATLTIRVAGPAKGRRGLLWAIRAQLRKIESTIPGLKGQEQVPVPGHPKIWVPYGHLINLESAGVEKVIPQGLTSEFPITLLLDGVEDRSDRALAHPAPSVPQPAPEQAEKGPAERFRVLSRPKTNAVIAIVALLVTLVGTWIAYLAYQGDERERNKPDSTVTTPTPSASSGPSTAPASKR
jgi:internalin A